MTQPLRVALLGCGVVGSEVARQLLGRPEEFAARTGASLELSGIAVRSLDRERPGIPAGLLTTDARALVADADIVVEVMGGIEPARSLILSALESGASVVTANKALLAQHGTELIKAAHDAGVRLEYEAAVAGAIPIVRPLDDSLAGDRVTRILGIVNGTTNFILDKMDAEGSAFDEVLAEAQELGYAEADPTADVDGHDAAAKAAILSSLAFHTPVQLDDVHVEGIRDVSPQSVELAREQGYVIKLLAICERVAADDAAGMEPGVSARVYPALIPRGHALAAVRGAYNAVFVQAEQAGSLMFYGQGAGGAPTSSAILGDIVSVARRRVLGGRGKYSPATGRLRIVPLDEIPTQYHVTLDVADKSGVLSRVTEVFAARGVSIESVRQTVSEQEAAEGRATLVISTHRSVESALAGTVGDLKDLDVVNDIRATLRIEGAA
ncbi:homoserine dehydrogenase [Sediminivirga luteola]|uniref:Homoserine dehydrogenase n=1 Tax=Sediminivirga luteola TaxID=1774748 RepID=A0A8J2TWF1_9MICO|nr:homoserine dehydrogenase [Sediminivirga luteola]MCI2266535.1 homoserine dehydrogenase [Sediminivirga luteola]GGA07738.1 homoserine dehydrogenase [Sediminivirga luteola]